MNIRARRTKGNPSIKDNWEEYESDEEEEEVVPGPGQYLRDTHVTSFMNGSSTNRRSESF